MTLEDLPIEQPYPISILLVVEEQKKNIWYLHSAEKLTEMKKVISKIEKPRKKRFNPKKSLFCILDVPNSFLKSTHLSIIKISKNDII